jgi:hypothetical protein
VVARELVASVTVAQTSQRYNTAPRYKLGMPSSTPLLVPKPPQKVVSADKKEVLPNFEGVRYIFEI